MLELGTVGILCIDGSMGSIAVDLRVQNVITMIYYLFDCDGCEVNPHLFRMSYSYESLLSRMLYSGHFPG